MEVILCPITGFCSGVRNALNLTADMLEQHGPPVFILHDLVHNESVVNDLLSRGAKIVDEPEGL
ncbi:MAG: 4-hydroxy-3-methylbut-2-enyl diphosphate reductase, partial [Lentisphaeria bacterium]|nr:4-hydroxy-3-methylbut-2-enyl diphosphate reductase [Lentisphaeria bacterium]